MLLHLHHLLKDQDRITTLLLNPLRGRLTIVSILDMVKTIALLLRLFMKLKMRMTIMKGVRKKIS
jgi:hypothetical protein